MEKEKESTGLKEVTREIVGLEDNKLFRTLKHLTTKPGEVIVQFCRGEKQKYLSPVVYFFGVTAIETFLAAQVGLLDHMLSENLKAMQQYPVFSESQVATINENIKFLFSETGQKIILVPVLLFFTWLFYKKYNKSFKENSWFALYTLAHITLLSLPLLGLWHLQRNNMWYSLLAFVVAIGYWTWASRQFYNLSWAKAFLIRVFMIILALLTINVGTTIMMILVLSTK